MDLDFLSSEEPAGAYDNLMATVLPAAREQRLWAPEDGPMPALFVSHGAPPVLDDARWLADLFSWGQSMPKPRGIVVVSAHWETAPVAISATEAGTGLYYDFGGFHPRYYTVIYPTPDAGDLGREVVGALTSTPGLGPIHQWTDRGLDHGAFIPLMAMFPLADVPVIQVSMPSLDPAALLALGERLRSLRAAGYLVIGSGYMTHSFAVFRQPSLFGHLAAFDEWAANTIADGDIDALMDYRRKAPGAAIAHPTADHFVPLLLTLGASTHPGEETSTAFTRFAMSNSIRSLQAA